MIESNGGWGISISNAVSGVQISSSAVQGNTLGGVSFTGQDHQATFCYIVGNGIAETADNRGGVVFGSSAVATNCRVSNCTIAQNTPWGVKRLSGSTGRASRNETYANAQLGYRILGAQPGISLTHFVVDVVHAKIVLGGTATANANESLDLEFFVPINDAPDVQGATYVSAADLTVTTNGSGSAAFYNTFSRSATFNGTALGLPQPLVFDIDHDDALVATATSSNVGTSQFSARAEPTLPGDFDLNGAVDGADYII